MNEGIASSTQLCVPLDDARSDDLKRQAGDEQSRHGRKSEREHDRQRQQDENDEDDEDGAKDHAATSFATTLAGRIIAISAQIAISTPPTASPA